MLYTKLIFKLYISRFKEDIDALSYLDDFKKFYEKHDAHVIGNWSNLEDPHEVCLLTEYKDEIHYQKFIIDVGQDKEYQKLMQDLDSKREDLVIKTLGTNYASKLQPSQESLWEYIRTVRTEFETLEKITRFQYLD